jgi:ABC-type methionine transport system permease subunit
MVGRTALRLPALGQTGAMVGIVISIVVALGLPLGLLIFNTSRAVSARSRRYTLP